MDQQLLELENNMVNYNKVKELVINQLINEGYMSDDEGKEFTDRCQILVYKGNWFSKWFERNMKDSSKENYYIRIIQMKDKETSLDDLIRRTAQG